MSPECGDGVLSSLFGASLQTATGRVIGLVIVLSLVGGFLVRSLG